MVCDTINNLHLYEELHPGLKDVVSFLKANDLASLHVGNIPVNDKGDFLLIQEYQTLPPREVPIECHRKLYDVQVMLDGFELVGYRNLRDCSPDSTYDPDSDFQKLVGEVDFIPLRVGSFMIFFPEDGHKPCVSGPEGASKVKKAVFKMQL